MVVIMIIILQLYIDSGGFYYFHQYQICIGFNIITTINKDFFKIHLWSMELTSIILNCPIHVIHS